MRALVFLLDVVSISSLSPFCTPYHSLWQGNSFSADMCAFGVVAWEISTRKVLFMKFVVEMIMLDQRVF